MFVVALCLVTVLIARLPGIDSEMVILSLHQTISEQSLSSWVARSSRNHCEGNKTLSDFLCWFWNLAKQGWQQRDHSASLEPFLAEKATAKSMTRSQAVRTSPKMWRKLPDLRVEKKA